MMPDMLVIATRASVRGVLPDPLMSLIPDGKPLRRDVLAAAALMLGEVAVGEVASHPHVDRRAPMLRARLRREARRPTRPWAGDGS